jgi:GTPase involved in cell partitioning and DNA repair
MISSSFKILRDITHDGEQFLAATGGAGGRGNIHGKEMGREPNDERAKGKPGSDARCIFIVCVCVCVCVCVFISLTYSLVNIKVRTRA